jgi:hypothetical protein
MNAKYIVVANLFSGEKIIIFPSEIDHIQMTNAMGMGQLRYDQVVSAGRIDDFMQCYGESITLNLKSRDEDTVILKKMLNIEDKKLVFKKEQYECRKRLQKRLTHPGIQ